MNDSLGIKTLKLSEVRKSDQIAAHSVFPPSPEIVEVVTPLYGFHSDFNEARIDAESFILKFNLALLDRFAGEKSQSWSFFQWFTPEYVLWRRVLAGSMRFDLEEREVRLDMRGALGTWLVPSWTAIRHLRLFKRGELRRGPTWIFGNVADGIYEAHVFAEGLHVDSLMEKNRTYGIESCDISNLERFRRNWKELRRQTTNLRFSKRLSLALDYFENSHEKKSPKQQLIDLSVAMEALLLGAEEGLSFKLANRGANLLGRNSADRKFFFSELKRFYDLRSKLIHGETLNNKQNQLLEQIGFYRELTRYLILAAVACAASGQIAEIPASIDELSLDEMKRDAMQAFICGHFELGKPPEKLPMC